MEAHDNIKQYNDQAINNAMIQAKSSNFSPSSHDSIEVSAARVVTTRGWSYTGLFTHLNHYDLLTFDSLLHNINSINCIKLNPH